MRPIFLLLLLPLVEIAVFIWVGGAIGIVPTILLVILAVILGLAILRYLGTNIATAAQTAFANGSNPGAALAENGLLMVAAILFIVPGFLSDVFALILLPRPVRRLLIERFVQHSDAIMRTNRHDPQVLDGEYEIVQDPETGVNRYIARPD